MHRFTVLEVRGTGHDVDNTVRRDNHLKGSGGIPKQSTLQFDIRIIGKRPEQSSFLGWSKGKDTGETLLVDGGRPAAGFDLFESSHVQGKKE
jgi:hypothetical protein